MHFSDENWSEILKLIQRKMTMIEASKGSSSFMAFWDFDGTIIKGDISEGWPGQKDQLGHRGLMEEVFALKIIPQRDEYSEKYAFWKRYYQLIEEGESLEAYILMAKLLSNLPQKDKQLIDELVVSQFKRFFKKFLLQSTLYLFNSLTELGVEHAIISASPQIFVQGASAILPLSPEFISGIDCERDIENSEVNYGVGKAKRILTYLEKRKKAEGKEFHPIFAIGNSWNSDGPMCKEVVKSGGIGLIINGGSVPSEYESFHLKNEIYSGQFSHIKY